MAKQPEMKVVFLDPNSTLTETFVDSFHSFEFKDNILRFDMCSTRVNVEKNTAVSRPVCRVIMPLVSVISLNNAIQNLFTSLEQSGLIKREGANTIVPSGSTTH